MFRYIILVSGSVFRSLIRPSSSTVLGIIIRSLLISLVIIIILPVVRPFLLHGLCSLFFYWRALELRVPLLLFSLKIVLVLSLLLLLLNLLMPFLFFFLEIILLLGLLVSLFFFSLEIIRLLSLLVSFLFLFLKIILLLVIIILPVAIIVIIRNPVLRPVAVIDPSFFDPVMRVSFYFKPVGPFAKTIFPSVAFINIIYDHCISETIIPFC